MVKGKRIFGSRLRVLAAGMGVLTALGWNSSAFADATVGACQGANTGGQINGTVLPANQSIQNPSCGPGDEAWLNSNAGASVQANGNDVVLAPTASGQIKAEGTMTMGGNGITSLKNGAVSSASTEAVNGSQLYGTAQSVSTALGGGSVVNPDGTVSMPTYSVGGAAVSGVGGAITSLDGRVTNVDARVTNVDARVTKTNQDLATLTDGVNNGTVGLVQQDQTTRKITVAKDQNATVVDMTGTAGTRTVTGVSAGAVNRTSADAVNGSQLYGTAQSVSNALGGGSKVNADGTVSAPTYYAGGKQANNVGDAIMNLDGQINSVARKAYSGVAGATALSMIPDVEPGKTFGLGVGAAQYQGYGAVAVSASGRIRENFRVKAGVGVSAGGTTFGGGASYQW